MQGTPKTSKKASSQLPRKLSPIANSSEVAQKISPRAISSEKAQRTSGHGTSSVGAQKIFSPRAVRKLNITAGSEPGSASSSGQSSRTPRKTSPKVTGHRSPKSPVPMIFSPRAARKLNITAGSEPGSASSSGQSSRTPRKTSPKVTGHRSPKSPVPVIEKRRVSKVAELESLILQHQEDLNRVKDELNSSNASKKKAEQETAESKEQLAVVSSKLEESILQESHITKSQNLSQELGAQIKIKQRSQAELASAELLSLKGSLNETIFFVEDLKKRMEHCKESEDKALALVAETTTQLEMVKMTIDTLKRDGVKTKEAYDALAFDLDQSRAHLDLLEGIVDKVKADKKFDDEVGEINLVKYEIGQLSLTLESTAKKYYKEETQRMVEIACVNEFVEEIESKSRIKEAEIELKIRKVRADIENLNLLKKNKDDIRNLNAIMMEKETLFHNLLDENGMLKLKRKSGGTDDVAFTKAGPHIEQVEPYARGPALAFTFTFTELEAARAAEEQARAKLADVAEEAEKSERRLKWAAEQLEVAEVANAETEAELRRLRVQSEQWRKAAEAASEAVVNNGKFVERTRSYDSVNRRVSSPNLREKEGDFGRKKNGNVLKRIGAMWKKQQK